MRAVHVSISHDDYLVVAQLGIVVGLADAGAQCCDQRPDLLVVKYHVLGRFLHIEYFTFEGQDGLEIAVAPLLG